MGSFLVAAVLQFVTTCQYYLQQHMIIFYEFAALNYLHQGVSLVNTVLNEAANNESVADALGCFRKPNFSITDM